MMRKVCTWAAAVTTLLVALSSPATAQVEVEVDPIAYVLDGYSLHVAKVLGVTRLNIGVFGADVPESFHGNEGWSARMRGAGVKWDYLGRDLNGLFVGLDGGYMHTRYALDGMAGTEAGVAIGIGVRSGYRLPIGRGGLYVVPWVSVSYNSGDDVSLGGSTFERRALEMFPTVHIGWRF